MSTEIPTDGAPPGEPGRGFLGWWHRTPLYLRILGAMVLAVPVGLLLGKERPD